MTRSVKPLMRTFLFFMLSTRWRADLILHLSGQDCTPFDPVRGGMCGMSACLRTLSIAICMSAGLISGCKERKDAWIFRSPGFTLWHSSLDMPSVNHK